MIALVQVIFEGRTDFLWLFRTNPGEFAVFGESAAAADGNEFGVGKLDGGDLMSLGPEPEVDDI